MINRIHKWLIEWQDRRVNRRMYRLALENKEDEKLLKNAVGEEGFEYIKKHAEYKLLPDATHVQVDFPSPGKYETYFIMKYVKQDTNIERVKK